MYTTLGFLEKGWFVKINASGCKIFFSPFHLLFHQVTMHQCEKSVMDWMGANKLKSHIDGSAAGRLFLCSRYWCVACLSWLVYHFP